MDIFGAFEPFSRSPYHIGMKKGIIKFIRTGAFQPLWEKLHHLSKIGMNYWGGASLYESGEISAMKYAVAKLKGKNSITLFDVGANDGQFALLASQLFPIQTTIYSFEPSHHTFKVLNEQINKANISMSRIKTFNFGLGAQKETLTLYAAEAGATTASLYNMQRHQTISAKDNKEEVSIRTLDDFCAEMQIQQIDYLKIDIEGHEYFCLTGARQMLENRHIRFIQFEFGECHIDSKTFFRDFYRMLSPQYHLYRIVSDGVRQMKSYSTDLEVFDTANYLAELKQ